MNHRIKLWIGIALTFMAGGSFVLWMTHPVIGVHDDGFALLQPALTGNPENLTPHFPPLYPWLLYGMTTVGLDWNWSARLINALSLPMIALLMAGAVCRPLLNLHRWFLIAAIMLSFTSLFRHAWVTAEPLFHLLTVLSFLIWLTYWRQTRHTTRWAALAGLCTAVAVGVRYVGLSLWLVAPLPLLLKQWRNLTALIKDGLAFSGSAGIPFLLLIWWNRQRAETSVNRDVVMLGLPPERLAQLRISFLEFFLPYRIFDAWPVTLQWGMLLSVILLLAVGSILTMKRFVQVYVLMWGFIFAYLGIVCATIAFSDRTTPFDHRILAPIYICIVSLIACVSSGLSQMVTSRHPVRLFVMAGLAVFLSFVSVRGIAYAYKANAEGLGHFSQAWLQSETMAFVEKEIEHRTIYSHSARSFNFRLGANRVRTLPYKETVYTGLPNEEFEDSLESMAADLRDNGAILVFSYLFHRSDADFPPYLPTSAELRSRLNLVTVTNLADGFVLGWRPGDEE